MAGAKVEGNLAMVGTQSPTKLGGRAVASLNRFVYVSFVQSIVNGIGPWFQIFSKYFKKASNFWLLSAP